MPKAVAQASLWVLTPAALALVVAGAVWWVTRPGPMLIQGEVAGPPFLNAMAQLVPSTPAIDGLVRVSQMGARLPDVAITLWHLWALTAGLGLVAVIVDILQTDPAPVQTRPLPIGLVAS